MDPSEIALHISELCNMTDTQSWRVIVNMCLPLGTCLACWLMLVPRQIPRNLESKGILEGSGITTDQNETS